MTAARIAAWISRCSAIGVMIAAAIPAHALDKPAIFGNPNLIIQQPNFAPPPNISSANQAAPRVPSNQIGFQNPSSSNVAAIVDLASGQKPVLLKAHEFQTVDCGNCAGTIKAIVPRGTSPTSNDFSITVRPGTVYRFEYDTLQKRWILVQQ
jgi:hypothetical protein